jgi:uncharacterized protein
MRRLLPFALFLFVISLARADARLVFPPYPPPKVVFDFYLDDPAKMGAALYWLRGLLLPLSEAPYDYDPETIKVVIHGAELVTLAKKNEDKYKDFVERMRYYADLGIEFEVCHLAMEDYGYNPADMQDFVQVVPSAMAELAYRQNQGFAVLTPHILEKHFSVEKIR